MKRYDKYKDSGVAWLGQVPSHWEVCKVKNKYEIQTGFTPATKEDSYYDDENGYTWVTIGDISKDKIHNSQKKVSKKYLDQYNPSITPAGSLLYSFKLSVGTVAFAGIDLYTNEAIASFLGSDSVNLRFLKYSSYLIANNCNYNTYGAPIMNQELISNAPIIFPPLAEQEAIAAYLDEKCEAIDGMVEKIEEKIALFQRLRRAIIKKSCTEIKDFKEMPLRHVFHFRNGYTPSKLVPEFWENGTIPWFRMEDIRTNGRILSDSIQHITPLAVKGELFEKNSFLLATTATIGEHAWLIADSLANQQFTNLKIRKSLGSVDYRFFFYLFFEIDEFCKETCHVSTFPSVNTDELKAFKVKIPPLAEQQAIADYLDRKCGKIDELVAKYEQQKELLARYKKALIAQVITGQRRVCKPIFNYKAAELDKSPISMAAEN